MSDSSLVTYKRISPNRTSPRKYKIDTITIHCYVGQITVERAGEGFADPTRDASCNYVVDKDGRIGLIVNESDRSWCTGGNILNNGLTGSENDHRAVTIEVASDSTHPYKVNEKAMAALIELCADICKRNGIQKLVWSDQKADRINHRNGCNMTVHRDYASKACPGDYLYSKMPEIASKVNSKLQQSDPKAKLVKDLYCTLLGRQAKPAEVDRWAVHSEIEIFKGIYSSQECQTLYIRRLYRELLNREGSPAEVNGWLAQLKKISRDAVYSGFINSPEYKALHSKK